MTVFIEDIRGHSEKIRKTQLQLVIETKDVRQFKINMDKYLEHQDVKFDFKANIQNKKQFGNHTEISCNAEEKVI